MNNYTQYMQGLESSTSLIMVGVLWSIVCLALSIVIIVAMWMIFKKAGEPGWAAIVPFYNTYVLFKITWGQGWMFLLGLIPIVNLVISIMTFVKLSNVFGKSGGFAVGLILLSGIFLPILGFGSAEYIGLPEKKA